MRTPPARARACRSLLLGALAFAQTDELPGDPFQRLGPEVQRELAAVDPAATGWDSEARADAASRQLGEIARFLEGIVALGDLLRGQLFAPGFGGAVPGQPFTIRAHAPSSFWGGAGLLVQRQRTPPPSSIKAEFFLEGLRSSMPVAREFHVTVKIIHVEEAPEGFLTRALLSFEGRAASGPFQSGPFQVTALWECSWLENEDEPPRLSSVRLLEHEQVNAAGRRLFSDCSEALFGSNDSWSEQLLPGLPAWRARLDTRLGVPLLGHAAGIAIADVDGDGLEDIYLCQPGGLPNKLFLHRPDGSAVDRSAEAGVDFLDFSRAALLVDLDGDGDRDLAVNAAERLLLLSNDGKGRFWLQAALESPFATSMAAADVDLDGDLDLYVCSYASPYDHSALPLPYHDAQNGKPNHLFENHGDWIFLEATEERGLDHNNTRFSFAASFEDYDLDGDPDLYVANDFGRNNLYRNDEGKFVDVAAAAGVEDVSAGMGVSWGDVDGDGRFDLYVSNMYSSAGNRIAYQRRFQGDAGDDVRALYQRHAHGNTLFRNRGDGGFEDVSGTSPLGVSMGRWAWGGLFADLNGDGWQDLLSPNGFITEEREDDL